MGLDQHVATVWQIKCDNPECRHVIAQDSAMSSAILRAKSVHGAVYVAWRTEKGWEERFFYCVGCQTKAMPVSVGGS